MIAARLIGRHEWVQIGKLWPSHWDHLYSGVELHRAAAQWDHSSIQRQIAVCQPAHVAGDFRFGTVEVENGMCEIGVFAQHGIWQAIGAVGLAVVFQITTKGAPHRLDGFWACLLIKADADTVRINLAQVDSIGHSGLKDHPLEVTNMHGDRVKEDLRLHIKA